MSSAPPKILYVTPFWPHRSAIGAEVRSSEVLRALQTMGQVEVVVLDDEGAAAPPPGVREQFNITTVLTVKPVPRKGMSDKLKWFLDPQLPFPHGCGVEETGQQLLQQKAAQADLLWFFKLRTPNMFAQTSWPRSVVDIDDVPSTFEAAAMQRGGWRDRLLARMRCRIWRGRERLLGERFSVLGVCSERDRQYLEDLGIKVPVHVIPNGFTKPVAEPVRRLATPPRLGFIGLFDYFPNREGIEWFVKNCWGRIKREIPDARLRLVGKGSVGLLDASVLDVDALGWVESPSAEMATWAAMIVPIRVGAGTRVKIAQGFAQKCPIVSTSLGAYGYGTTNGQELFLADAAADFANACIRVIRQPEESAQMAERAWRQFLARWTWDAIRPRIQATVEAGLAAKGER